MILSTAARTVLGATFLLCAACAQGDFTGSPSMTISDAPAAAPRPAARPKAPDVEPRVAQPLVMPTTPPPAPAELSPLGPRGRLLHRLPKSTLLALRFPHVEELARALERTPISKLFSDPRMGAAVEQFETSMAQFEASLSREFSDYEDLRARLGALEGELVIALLSLDASVFTSGSTTAPGCPFTAAVMFDAGERANELDGVLQRILTQIAADESPNKPEIEVVSTSKQGWHRRLGIEDLTVDLVRDGGAFLLQAGPSTAPGSKSAPLAARQIDDSFASAHIVRATRDLSREGSLPVAELFLNLDPVWTVTEMFAPPEVKRVLEACGATSIHGVSAAAAIGATGIDEVVFVDAPGGRDLLTRVIAGKPLEAQLARFLPRNAQSASLGTFDVQALFDGVQQLLPANAQQSLAQSFDGLEKQGFDLRGDLIANVGPTIGFCGDIDAIQRWTEGAIDGALDVTLVVEVADGERLKGLIDRALASAGPSAAPKSRIMEGFTTWSLEPVPLPGPNGRSTASIEPSWYVGEDVFVVSLTSTGLARALVASKQSGNRGPQAIADALEKNAGAAFSIGIARSADEGTGSTTVGRRTSLGLEIVTRDGDGTSCGYALVGGMAIGGAVAIPKLMTARVSANETAAISTLQSIAVAEHQFRAGRHVDLDHDGLGEFGTLGELTGATDLRGSKKALTKPLLPDWMRPDENDCFVHAGYVFRIDVAKRVTRTPNDEEREFTAFAWPLTPGVTGIRAFSVDAEGRFLSTDNRGEEQGYEGTARPPPFDASKRSFTSHTLVGVKGRKGRDGGVWTYMD